MNRVQFRFLVILVAFAGMLGVAGCGASTKSRTDLTILALNSWVGRSSFHLTCGPVGGDLPSPAGACRALNASPGLLRSKPFTCLGGTSSWWDITITGRLDERPVRRSFQTCWTPQMRLIGRLGIAQALQSHLLTRRQGMVVAGTTKTFPSGDLRPADLVTCDIRGQHLQLGVPLSSGAPAGVGSSGGGVVSVSFNVSLNRDRSVSAACHAQHRVAASLVTQPVSLRYLQMVDLQRGYALSGDGDTFRVLSTDDGGGIWTDITPGGGTYRATGPLTIHGSLLLFSTRVRNGAFAVEKSTDGGRTWQQSIPFRDSSGAPAPASPQIVDAGHFYLSVNEGAAAGSSSQALFASSDGGRHWRFISRTSSANPGFGQLPFGCDKSGFGFATVKRGFAGGYCAGGQPFFYRTDDGGHTWQRAALPAPQACACDVTAPTFFTHRLAALAVYGFAENGNGEPFAHILWTSDAGAHWRGTGPPVGRASPPVIANARVVWVTGQLPGNLRAPFNRLWRTTDAGAHWISTKLPFDGQAYQLDPLDNSTAFALSIAQPSRSILLTKDGGKSWRAIKTYLAR